MNSDKEIIEQIIKEVSALLDERSMIEKQLIPSKDIDEKIRLLMRKDEIIQRLNELKAKILEFPESKVITTTINTIAVANVGTIYMGDDPSSQKSKIESQSALRKWWHNILREFGKYPCYAVFLLLPSDKETIRYLSEFGKELDLLSGKECLVLAFGKSNFKGPKFDNDTWSIAVNEHVSEGISVTLAKILNIEFTQLPCLVIFNDIRSPEHVIIDLKNYEAEQVAKNMRQVFWTINKSISKKQNPIHALSLLHKKEGLQKTSLSIVSELRSFAGKTLDTAMEAFIKANIQ